MSPTTRFSSGLTRSKVVTAAWTGAMFVVFFSNARMASAHPKPTPGLSDHIDNILLPHPNKTGGPAGEIQCYALPYGAVGIVSHLLTYWTMAWLMVGKTPIWPWHQPSYAKLDIALALATLLTCIPIASITIQRCRLTWHFILIAIWKLVTSVALSCTTIHRALISRRENHLRAHNRRESRRRARNPQSAPYQSHGMYEQIGASRSTLFNADEGGAQVQEDQTPLFWLILYLVGTMTGMAGLLALNWSSFRDNHDVRSLTYGFGVTIIIIPVMAAAYWYMKHLDLGHDAKGRDYVSAGLHMAGSFFVAGAAAFGFFSALYCDLVLAAIAQNWSGMPSEDFAPLYWAWFVAKRFPMLSI